MKDQLKKMLWKYYRGEFEILKIFDQILQLMLGSFPNSPPKIIRSFMGTIEEANLYLENGFYIALTGYLCKVKFNDIKLKKKH